MTTRRRFLASAASLPFLASLPALAENNCAPLPPAIAALKSRRHEAHPITMADRESRFERARQLMAANQMDAIFLIGGTSLEYFTGIEWWNSERLGAFILPQKGSPFYVVPAFEEARLREQLAQVPDGTTSRIYIWQENEDPYALTIKALREAGVSTGKLGMEENVTFVFSNGIAQILAKAAPALSITSATPVTAGCRSIKSSAELALMTLANSVTLQAYKAAWQSLKPGMTNDDVSNLISKAYAQLGFPDGEASCQVGEYSALPHGSLQPQVIREGEIILIDDGCKVAGYQSDISRSFVLGKATDKQKRIFEIVHRAQAKAIATARPGIQAQAVDAAAREVIEDAGYGPGYKYFSHRVGHGIGMDMHEWPYLVQGNSTLLAPGMCFSDEPGIYIQGEFGIRLEDDIHITEDGAQFFTRPSHSLEEPFS